MENVIGKEEAKKEIDLTRYIPHIKIAQSVMDAFGERKTIATFITHSNKLIAKLESVTIDGRDALHYMSDFVNDQKHFGKIPPYSPRTKLFSKMEKLTELLGISKENIPTIQKEWEQAELDGCASEVVPEILLKYKTKELSSEELRNFETFIAIYKNLLLDETKFYDSLGTLLKPQQFVGDDR